MHYNYNLYATIICWTFTKCYNQNTILSIYLSTETAHLIVRLRTAMGLGWRVRRSTHHHAPGWATHAPSVARSTGWTHGSRAHVELERHMGLEDIRRGKMTGIAISKRSLCSQAENLQCTCSCWRLCSSRSSCTMIVVPHWHWRIA